MIACTCGAVWADPHAAFTNAKAQAISACVIMVMTGATRNIAIAGQDLIVEEELTDPCLIFVKGDEIICADRRGQLCKRRPGKKEKSDMKYTFHAVILALFGALSSPALADLEVARDLMEENRFEEALTELWPAARSGNAEAEELIGIMYALGLGVEQDYQRAFDWYLRASMKGHPGAQSGVGWYYEVGLGMPEPDLVRAYMWYTLSAIGGDPDAADSMEQVIQKMSRAEIDQALIMVGDYKVWLYPFR